MPIDYIGAEKRLGTARGPLRLAHRGELENGARKARRLTATYPVARVLRCKTNEHGHQGPGVEFDAEAARCTDRNPTPDELIAAARELNMIAMPLHELKCAR